MGQFNTCRQVFIARCNAQTTNYILPKSKERELKKTVGSSYRTYQTKMPHS